MSSPTYDVVRVLEVAGASVRLRLGRVPEPPFDDPVTKGLGLMLLASEAVRPDAPIRQLSLEELMRQPRPPDLIDRYIVSVDEVARRNEVPDFYEQCRTRFGDDEGSHAAYCAFYRDESNLFQLELVIRATDARWTAHLTPGMTWATTAYAPEIYDRP